MTKRIEILDTTLRDGAQGEGVIFSMEDKLRVIRALDGLGVDYIEAGNPASNPKDEQLFRYAAGELNLKNAVLTAFGATRRPSASAREDMELNRLRGCGAKAASLFGKAWKLHARRVLGVSPAENIALISDSVKLLADAGMRVLFDAEHFFDGFADDPEYALSALRAAREAGAYRLILCDTNGGALPEAIRAGVSAAAAEFGDRIGIHCHDDAGLAVACSMAAIEAGAVQAQGSINGYGERCGNANLCSLIPNLALKMERECLIPGALPALSGAARLISDIANLPMNERSPYVGRSAFAHKGGMHIDAMLKDARTFEHVPPELIGGERRYLVSEMAGRGALLTRLSALRPGIEKGDPETARILSELKRLEADGYSFEGAEASLHLRLLGLLGERKRFFEVLDFHVVSRKPENDKNAQAYVKVRVDGQVEITADEGDGPVNAIDLAVRKALSRFFPVISSMRLKDFKVRVVNSAGTASAVRVAMESTDGVRVWSTVGVSSNVIEASLIALTDSIDFLLIGQSEGWPRAGLR